MINERERNNEFNNKYSEDEFNSRNYNHNIINQSVKNIYQEEEKHAAELLAIQLEVMNQAKAAKFSALAKPKKVSKG